MFLILLASGGRVSLVMTVYCSKRPMVSVSGLNQTPKPIAKVQGGEADHDRSVPMLDESYPNRNPPMVESG